MMTAPDADAAAGPEIPAGDVRDEEVVDMQYLAGQRPPEEGAWLLVSAVDAGLGSEFTAVFLPRTRPKAGGGDVLVHIAPGKDDTEQQPVTTARVRVSVVAARSLIQVASWDRLDADRWPEQIRATTCFAMGVLRELGEHGADIRATDMIDVNDAAKSPVAGFPCLPTR